MLTREAAPAWQLRGPEKRKAKSLTAESRYWLFANRDDNRFNESAGTLASHHLRNRARSLKRRASTEAIYLAGRERFGAVLPGRIDARVARRGLPD